MEKLENINRHLREEIEKERLSMEYYAERKLYTAAAACMTKIEAYEKAIYIVNTLC